MLSKPIPMCPDLQRAINAARKRFEAMTPAEQEAHLREQRASWVRGEKGIGDDKDEAAFRSNMKH